MMRIPYNSGSMEIIVRILRAGKLVIMKCDTIYGILGRFPEAYGKICTLKGRRPDKPFLVLVPSREKASELSNRPLPPELETFWPGALTVVLSSTEYPPSLALRFPDDPYLIEIMKKGELLLYSTSVNYSDSPALNRIEEIFREFGDKVDLVVDAGDLEGGVPSTLLDVRTKPWKVLRPGAVEIPAHLLSS